MKYKVGDKVRIKKSFLWDYDVLIAFDKLSDGIATIKKLEFAGDKRFFIGYCMKEIDYLWQNYEIKGLEEVFTPIESRFELLDFD